jgi:hypothetical protein
MKIEKTFLKSKVGRRIMGLFVFCALVPISALAIVSFTRVSGELDKQNERQLHQSCKALVMSILERMKSHYEFQRFHQEQKRSLWQGFEKPV